MTETQMERMHLLKTGALIKASVMLGYHLADLNNEELSGALENYAHCLGLAFQVQDDILDVEGDTEIIGKPQGSDHVSDKATYPKLLGLKQAKKTADNLISNAIASLEILKDNGEPLRILAEYVIKREK